ESEFRRLATRRRRADVASQVPSGDCGAGFAGRLIFSLCQEHYMLLYKAMYKTIDEGVHAEVLNFPGTISFGADLEEGRRMLASALVDMAETNAIRGEPLPTPDTHCTDPNADLEEPILCRLASSFSTPMVRPALGK